MINNEKTWLWDTLSDCCEKHFSYKLADCKGSTTTSTNVGKFYPDWESNTKVCWENTSASPAPLTLTDAYFYKTLDECCEMHFSWNEDNCKRGGSSAATGYYESNNLHDTKAKCCSTHLSYAYKKCLE
eukprot:scaffold34759_cov57-Cyclotella_meneghiniana.AAC.8